MRQIIANCLKLHIVLVIVIKNQLNVTSAEWKRLHANKIAIYLLLLYKGQWEWGAVASAGVVGGEQIASIEKYDDVVHFTEMQNKHISFTYCDINYYPLASSCVHALPSFTATQLLLLLLFYSWLCAPIYSVIVEKLQKNWNFNLKRHCKWDAWIWKTLLIEWNLPKSGIYDIISIMNNR